MSVFYTINFIGLIVLHGFPYNEATQRLIPSPMMSQRKLFVLKNVLCKIVSVLLLVYLSKTLFYIMLTTWVRHTPKVKIEP